MATDLLLSGLRWLRAVTGGRGNECPALLVPAEATGDCRSEQRTGELQREPCRQRAWGRQPCHRRYGSVAVLLVMMTALGDHQTLAAGQVRLEIEAPPELAGVASQVARLEALDLDRFQELLGLASPGEPIRVVLLPESSELARHVPDWISGFARSEESLVVLFPHRVPSYPHASLQELVRHEIAHVLIHRAAAGGDVPRWLHEGLAMVGEGGWRVADRSRLAMAMLRSGEPSLSELSDLFGGDQARVSWAYAVSGGLVRDILRRHGRQAMLGVFEELRRGLAFAEAFEAVIGNSPDDSLARFWSRTALWYRWLPFLTSTTVLWIAVSMLALVAIRRRRERDRELFERWEEEERRQIEELDERVN